MSKSTRLVYSTDVGRVKTKDAQTTTVTDSDGIVRIRRETKGRNGKGVTTLTGFALPQEQLKDLAKKLKQHVSTGGTLKDGVIEIQGDQRDKLKAYLESLGFTVKLAGG